jgi:hypothetical protein
VLERHTENFNLGKSWLIGDQTSTAVGSAEAPLVSSLARQRWRINKSAPDRSELLPNRRLLGLGDEEGLGRLFADDARGGEHTRALSSALTPARTSIGVAYRRHMLASQGWLSGARPGGR